MLGIPGEMHENLRLDFLHDAAALEQVGLVPGAAGQLWSRAARDGVHLMARRRQRREHLPAHQARGSREQDTAHGAKSG